MQFRNIDTCNFNKKKKIIIVYRSETNKNTRNNLQLFRYNRLCIWKGPVSSIARAPLRNTKCEGS